MDTQISYPDSDDDESDIDRVLDGLYVGGMRGAMDENGLRQRGITHVLNMATYRYHRALLLSPQSNDIGWFDPLSMEKDCQRLTFISFLPPPGKTAVIQRRTSPNLSSISSSGQTTCLTTTFPSTFPRQTTLSTKQDSRAPSTCTATRACLAPRRPSLRTSCPSRA